jgi:hypothetical protein
MEPASAAAGSPLLLRMGAVGRRDVISEVVGKGVEQFAALSFPILATLSRSERTGERCNEC